MKKLTLFFLIGVLLINLSGCSKKTAPKIGVSFGVGSASRWEQEKNYMEEHAQKLGAEIEVHLSRDADGSSQMEDCKNLINSGIDVLIMRPKDTKGIEEVIELAKKKNVKIICYASLVEEQPVDLFVGYDCDQIGQAQGKYLTEMVTTGNYIILSGDPDDKFVSIYLYDGAMKYISQIKDDINVILDASIVGWKPDVAKSLVREAILKNDNKIDAILAPNDAIAGACAEVIEELGITNKVVITGMDAQLDAVKRIVAGKQSSTIYMDGKTLANTAVEEAYKMAKGETIVANSEIDNGSGTSVPANLINKESLIPANLIAGRLVVKENIDRVLIESGSFTKEEIYGE